MKYFYLAALFLILVVLPALSWVFLKKGESALKDMLVDITVVKDSIDQYQFLYTHELGMDTIGKDELNGQLSIFFQAKDYSILKENLVKLDEQLKKAYELEFIQLLSNDNNTNTNLSNEFNLPIKNYQDLNGFSNGFGEYKLAFVDMDGKLRCYYKNTREDFVMMIQHLALLLPEVERGK